MPPVLQCVFFSPVGSCIVSCYDDTTITLWDSSTGAKLHVLNHAQRLTDLGYSSQGTHLILKGDGGQFHLWDEVQGRCCAEGASYYPPNMLYGSTAPSPRKFRNDMHLWNMFCTDIRAIVLAETKRKDSVLAGNKTLIDSYLNVKTNIHVSNLALNAA